MCCPEFIPQILGDAFPPGTVTYENNVSRNKHLFMLDVNLEGVRVTVAKPVKANHISSSRTNSDVCSRDRIFGHNWKEGWLKFSSYLRE